MGEKIVVGQISKGLRTGIPPFNVDNDSFPQLINAYQWRQRIRRKRGTASIGRLQRYFNSTNASYGSIATITLNGSGQGNLIDDFSLYPGSSIIPGTVIILDTISSITYTDPLKDGTLSPSGSINYASGAITILAAAGHAINASFRYTPNLPVMGLEDLILPTNQFPGTLGFDTKKSYNILPTTPHNIYNVSFYKNPATATYPSYVQKTNPTPVSWNGEDYRQFWTTNYQGALWATNGVAVPFASDNVGMQFKPIVTFRSISTGTPSLVNFQISSHGLVVGDFVFINETTTDSRTGVITNVTQANPAVVTSSSHGLSNGNTVTINGVVGMTQLNGNTYTVAGVTTNTFQLAGINSTGFTAYISGGFFTSPIAQNPISSSQINFQTGYVTVVIDASNITVEFPNANIVTSGTGGIAQYLTSNADSTKDCLRWYDGDPTDGSALGDIDAPILNTSKGWVNFMPPLSQFNGNPGNIADGQYYLVGAKLVQEFKDRLLFFGPVVQTSTGSPIYLQDTITFSLAGPAYYTASFTATDILAADNEFHPILTPGDTGSTPAAYFEDATGFGGSITNGVDQPIITVSNNQDILILGFRDQQSRLVYTGTDIIPFNFFTVNSEYGSNSTFSVINLDQGVITRGNRGFILTGQDSCQRIDLDIPDQVFQMALLNNGNERITAQRDFINEWIYFTYRANNSSYVYPTETLLYNYRDNSWAIFNESYTTYGPFRQQTGMTWGTVSQTYPTWAAWTDPWNAGESTTLQPEVIAGNQQGFVLLKDEGIDEANSLYISNIVASSITSPNHCLVNGDKIIISNCLGTVASQVNGKIFTVTSAENKSFTIYPSITTATYLGNGVIKKIYTPFIQSKQFPVAWEMGRKTRLGAQQYLLTKTPSGQITLLIYLSQNSAGAYNDGPVVPEVNSVNESLIYSTVLYTCPESTNLGLTPANTNLQMPTASQQQQIWHRINTSLLGDTVQVGFTLSNDQLTAFSETGASYAITGATNANPCVLTCAGKFQPSQMIKISSVTGMTDLNFTSIGNNYYQVISSTDTTVTINVDSTSFPAYVSGGAAIQIWPASQFAEIELFGFILDVNPSSLLA